MNGIVCLLLIVACYPLVLLGIPSIGFFGGIPLIIFLNIIIIVLGDL